MSWYSSPSLTAEIESKVHHRLQDFRTCSIQFVKKQDDRFAVNREPIGRQESGSLARLGGKTNQVAWVRHLSQEKRNDPHTFLLVIFGQYFRLANTMTPHQHNVMRGGGHFKDMQ